MLNTVNFKLAIFLATFRVSKEDNQTFLDTVATVILCTACKLPNLPILNFLPWKNFREEIVVWTDKDQRSEASKRDEKTLNFR